MKANPHWLLPSILVGAALGLAGCDGDDAPAGPSVTLAAPSPVSPSSGDEVSNERPTLVVSNVTASDGSTPVYEFQVATDSAFGDVVARATEVTQGGSGQTSWQVNTPLANGRHFWRARARIPNVMDGPLSSPVEFSVLTAFVSPEPRAGVLVFDPLTNGSSVGRVLGGRFTDQGWQVVARSNAIYYDLPTISSGFLEFDITGLDIRNPTRDARHLFFMWDPTLGGDPTQNRFRVSLQKLDNRSSINDRWLRLRFISQGRQIDEASTFRGWVPDRTYRIRLEWGPEGEVNVCRLFVNEMELIFFHYPRPYIPAVHRVELGAAERAETHENAIYSNVRIGVK